MSTLVLDSLEIKNFRAFKHLRIEKLGRVNLIVGKNNVGKTSVLEALWLYGRNGDISLIWNILGARDESGSSMSNLPPSLTERISSVRFLFHGRKPISEGVYPLSISVGPIDKEYDKTFFIDIAKPIAESRLNGNESSSADAFSVVADIGLLMQYPDADFLLNARYGNQLVYYYSLTADEPQTKTFKTDKPELNCVFISAVGLTSRLSSQLWDAITSTSAEEAEEDVQYALRLIAAEVERVGFVSGDEPFVRRHPIVKLTGLESPVPLRSLGEGMNRMLGIALALVNAKDGMLLIDEVDTGLHYSVLPDMWKLIFEVAHRLNVQVFATSHSWDCIQAFQQAAADSKEAEGVLVRLEQRKDGIGAVTFDEDELAIVTREQIEVR